MFLACNYSDELIELLNEGSVDIDYIKLGIMSMYDNVYEKALSLRPVLLHGLGFNEYASMKNTCEINWILANQYISKFKSPQTGFHLMASSGDWSDHSDEMIIEHIITVTKEWNSKIAVPFLIENMPYSPFVKRQFGALELCADPNIICTICEKANVNLILDIAHAKVTATSLGINVYEYIDKFPLARVKEIHVVGTDKINDTELIDKHVEMEDEDYKILLCVLQKTKPNIVTLEYGGPREHFLGESNKDALRRQLIKLMDICKVR